MLDRNFSREDYQATRRLVNQKRVILPSYDRLKNVKDQCRPPGITASVDKVTVRLQDLAEHTVGGVLEDTELAEKIMNLKELNGGEIVLNYNFKLGIDGSKGFQIVNTRMINEDQNKGALTATNFVGLNLWTVFNGKITILHQNSLHNSSHGVRPFRYFLCLKKIL